MAKRCIVTIGREYGRQCESNSYQLKAGDTVTCRGFGKFIYEGVKYETKKGKICAEISVYI